MQEYCVYIFFTKEGAPCYVGKGTRRRIWQHYTDARNGTHPNKELAALLREGQLPVVVIWRGASSYEAYSIECAFVKAIGRVANGGPLLNKTDGGGGVSGLSMSPELRARLSDAHKGKQSPMKGRRHTEESLAKMREAQSGRRASDETRAKMSASAKRVSKRGRKHSPEAVARKMPQLMALAEAKRGVPRPPEVREKLRQAAIKYYEQRRAQQGT